MDKKLKISLDLDDKSFIQGVKNAMEKIQSFQRDSKFMQTEIQLDQRLRSMGYGGFPGAPGYDQMVASRKRGEQEQKRYIEDLLKTRERLIKNEERLTRFKQAQIEAGKEIEKTEKSLEIIAHKRVENVDKFNAATEKSVRTYRELFLNMQKEFKLGGIGGLKEAWRGMNGTERFGFGATSIGGMLGGLGVGAEYMSRRPIDIAQMQGSAIAMTTGRQLREARTGEYLFESMYGGDRKKAQEQASSSRNLSTAGDILKLVGGTAALVAAIPTGGASLGLGGAILGGAGITGILGSGLLDPQKWSAQKSEQEAKDFTTMLDALHEKSPYRKDAIERIKSTGQRDLGMERTLGLNDFGYYGMPGMRGTGYLQSQMGLGFTDEAVTQASQGILGAGGSTAMALQSGIALQAERGLGLTNSQQLLGQISGTQGGIPESNKKTLIEIFARGFDSSKYAEENRKYMSAVTEQIFKGGTTSEAGAINVADLIKAAMGSQAPTTRGLESAKNAFEAFSSASTATSGFLGGINIASAMKDKDLSKLNPGELNALLKMKPGEIDENDPAFKALADKMNLDPKELATKLRNRQPENIRAALGQTSGMEAIGRAGNLIPGLDYKSAESLVNLVNQPSSSTRNEQIQKLIDEANNKMTNMDNDKSGDKFMQASALNAQNSLRTLSDSINQFATNVMEAAKKLGGQSDIGRAQEAKDAAAVAAAYKISDTSGKAQELINQNPWWLRMLGSNTQNQAQ